jgi:tetratricopeptide (TPR) repeat protein
MRYATVLPLVFMSLVLGPAGADAAPEEATSEDAADQGGNEAVIQAVQEGHQLVQRRQYAEAIEAYQRAVEVPGTDSWPWYFVACAQRSAGQLDDALASFQGVAEAAAENDAALKGRALMNIAWVHESRRDWTAARAAWQSYIAFAEAHAAIERHVATARQRLDVITAIEDLEAAYVDVRQRIAAEPEQTGNSSN